MYSPECEMNKLSLSLSPTFSEEEKLANIHFILEKGLVPKGSERTLSIAPF